MIVILLGAALLAGLALVLYQPFSAWYGQGYTQIEPWRAGSTSIGDYLSHWGLFLFVIVSWLFWETCQWMAATPLSHLRKLEPYIGLILTVLGVLIAWVVILVFLKLSGAEKAFAETVVLWYFVGMWLKASVLWLALPLAAWAAILLLRFDQPDAKRFVLFLIGTALVLTCMVEVIVMTGDIGRMNTVFKFYLQAWVLLGVSAAAALGWLWHELKIWHWGWRIPWKIVLVVLVFCAALYPVMAGMAKIKDRFVLHYPLSPDKSIRTVPLTLDGMDFMKYVYYPEGPANIDLSADYDAIRWMQENVQGSPVIVEANSGNLYRWYTRFTIFTGLPNVLGWEWHQIQQRALLPGDRVNQRLREINEFYKITDMGMAQAFLKKYNVRYVIFGELERVTYSGPGLNKFADWNGLLWNEVYRSGETVVYEVTP